MEERVYKDVERPKVPVTRHVYISANAVLDHGCGRRRGYGTGQCLSVVATAAWRGPEGVERAAVKTGPSGGVSMKEGQESTIPLEGCNPTTR